MKSKKFVFWTVFAAIVAALAGAAVWLLRRRGRKDRFAEADADYSFDTDEENFIPEVGVIPQEKDTAEPFPEVEEEGISES